MKKVLVVVLIIAAMAAAMFFWWVNMKNRLVSLDEETKAAWAQVENQLQRRMDLIPNLVATVKGYAAHEEKVFIDVTKARASVASASTTQEKINANNQLTNALSRLLVVVEKYPDLKANTNFLALQDELAGTENRIAVERKRYNDVARSYNATLRKFPYSLVSAGFEKAAYFEAAQGAKEVPKVSF
jgi:LemA protein